MFKSLYELDGVVVGTDSRRIRISVEVTRGDGTLGRTGNLYDHLTVTIGLHNKDGCFFFLCYTLTEGAQTFYG